MNLATAVRATVRFFDRGGTYHAAALTYYSLLSFFPAAGLVYGALGVLGATGVIEDVARELRERAVEPQFVDAIQKTVQSAAEQRSGDAVVAVLISLGATFVIASRWVYSADRALNHVLDRPHELSGRKLLERGRDTLVLMLLVMLALLFAFAGAALGKEVFGDALSVLWSIGAVAAAVTVGVGAFAYLYAFVPAAPRLGRGAIFGGAVIGTATWGLTTYGFRLFALHWPSYDTNYGVFATLVIAIVSIWLTNVAVLLGAAVAAEWQQR